MISMSDSYDVFIKNAKIVDGTGKPAFNGDIAIRDEKIVAVGSVKGDAAREINSSGLVACPGFVDPHSHADITILQYPLAENLVMQGITTFLGGNCGMSLAPLKDVCPADFVRARDWWHEVEPMAPEPPSLISLDKYADIIEKKLGFAVNWRSFKEFLSSAEKIGMSVNYAPLVGHNTIRIAVMKEDFKRKATSDEIKEMKKYVEEAMRNGAFGLSSFTDPSPGEYASVEELIELAKVAQKYGGLYVPHTRHTQSHWPAENPEEYGYVVYHGPIEDVWVGMYRGLIEAIEISRRARIPLHIAHLSDVYNVTQPHPDFLEEASAKATLEIIDKAREEGVDVTFDVIASGRSISSLSPLIWSFSKWLKEFGKEEFVKKLKTREFREEIKQAYESNRLKFGMIHTRVDPYWMNCFTILSCKNRKYEEKTIGEIAQEKNAEPLETIFDILIEDPDTKWVQSLDRRGTPMTVAVFLRHPFGMPSTDIGVQGPKPQIDETRGYIEDPPIAFGLYPDYIKTYVKDKKVLSLEEAIKKATYVPAQRLGLKGRGILSPGAYADITIFDFDKIRGKSTWLKPRQAPEGIEYVLVNGKIVYEKMKHTGLKSGKVLRHK